MVKRKLIKNKDNYKEHGCEFINETKRQEELDEDDLDLRNLEKEHFREDDKEIEWIWKTKN